MSEVIAGVSASDKALKGYLKDSVGVDCTFDDDISLQTFGDLASKRKAADKQEFVLMDWVDSEANQ